MLLHASEAEPLSVAAYWLATAEMVCQSLIDKAARIPNTAAS